MGQDESGYIEEDEKPHGNARKRGNPMEHLDKDGDGKVSRDEFPGPDNHFQMFDENKDGYLDEGELPKGPPRKRHVENT